MIRNTIDWRKVDGLLPAVVQDAATLQVLMLGYMDEEALAHTEESGRVTFFSRTRGGLWQKGETSGNVLEVDRIELDCDGDALLVLARPRGPTCHRETTSCFGEDDAPGLGWLARLAAVIDERKTADPDESYTASLIAGGIGQMAKKVGEEGVEVALAATAADGRLLDEAADLMYHLLVLLSASDKSLSDVAAILRERHAKS
jgi:phosphoribosyl-ATP pyrophosphohydrolase/phosphoribosyl-AMP cyclohydrolase